MSERPGHRRRLVWWGITLVVMATEFVLSSIPGDELAPPTFTLSDKLFHAIAYAAIAGAAALALGRGASRTRTVAIAVVIATCYGVTDELHQTFVPFRDASVLDLIADFTGAVIGATVAATLVYRRRHDAHS